MRTLTPQERRVSDLRESGKTYRVISQTIGISVQHAFRTFKSAKGKLSSPPHWTDVLSNRVWGVLLNNGLMEKESVKDALEREILHPTRGGTSGRGTRSYGWKSHYELMDFIKKNP